MLAKNQGRTTVQHGVRPFFKRLLYLSLCLLLAGILWQGNQLLLALIPEGHYPWQYFPTYPGDTWYIHFTHSVQKTPVEEFFTVNGVDDLTMTHTRYQSLGVGLPYAPSEGTLTVLKNEKLFDLEMNRPYQSVKLRTAVQALHKIIHQGQVYDLCALYGQGTLVEIKALKRYQLWVLYVDHFFKGGN